MSLRITATTPPAQRDWPDPPYNLLRIYYRGGAAVFCVASLRCTHPNRGDPLFMSKILNHTSAYII